MTEQAWREFFSPFRVELIDEAAKCWANQQSEPPNGIIPPWSALTDADRSNIEDYVASVFLALDEAMITLSNRGEGIWSE